jgi:hypothetical protein
VHQSGGEIAAAEADYCDQPPSDRSARGHQVIAVGMPEAAEVETEARAEHMHREREQHTGKQGAGKNKVSGKSDRFRHDLLVECPLAAMQADIVVQFLHSHPVSTGTLRMLELKDH